MGVYESGTEELPPQIYLLFRFILTNAHDDIPIYGYVRGIDFLGEDIDQVCIFQKEINPFVSPGGLNLLDQITHLSSSHPIPLG